MHLKDSREVNESAYDEKIGKELVEELKPFEAVFDSISDIEAREKETSRDYCKGFYGEADTVKKTERRFCKCLYYTNTSNNVKTECANCVLRDRQADGYHTQLAGNFKVIYYEFVPTDKGNGVGNVDLILADDNFAYLTEVKPKEGNSETLLRMFLEIETYSRVTALGNQYKNVVKDKPLRKAILFFKDSPQYKDYVSETKGVNTKKLLSTFGIAVLCAEIKDNRLHIKAIG